MLQCFNAQRYVAVYVGPHQLEFQWLAPPANVRWRQGAVVLVVCPLLHARHLTGFVSNLGCLSSSLPALRPLELLV